MEYVENIRPEKVENGKRIEAQSNGALADRLVQDAPGLERLLRDVCPEEDEAMDDINGRPDDPAQFAS